MAMGRRPVVVQGEFWIRTDRLRKAPGHPFYERLNRVLDQAGFDGFCESACEQFYAAKMGRPSVVPGVYFRMLMIGYFEKLDSERQIAWRCDDSRSLRAFLGMAENRATPDHSNLSRTRQRIDLEAHQQVFDWVLKRLAEHDLLKGKTLGVDASTMEATAGARWSAQHPGSQEPAFFREQTSMTAGPVRSARRCGVEAGGALGEMACRPCRRRDWGAWKAS